MNQLKPGHIKINHVESRQSNSDHMNKWDVVVTVGTSLCDDNGGNAEHTGDSDAYACQANYVIGTADSRWLHSTTIASGAKPIASAL